MGENQMRVLVTGHKGFIGTQLTRDLIHAGHTVAGYDLVDGQDIRNLHDLDKAFEYFQPNLVVHLAARAGVRRSELYPHEYLTTNIEGTWNIGKMCEKYNSKLIFFSSSSVYGEANPPTKETDPIKPISLYGMTKACGEMIVNQLKVQTCIIRPFTVYGTNGRGDQVFYKWLNQLRAGKPITVFGFNDEGYRGYTYIDDIVQVVKQIISFVEANIAMPIHEDFNIGGAEVISTFDIVRIFSSIIPDFMKNVQVIPRPSSDITSNYADITKARNVLGYQPAANFTKNLTTIIFQEYPLTH
jgi:UDP-glucuronate 4-epimerase